ncbi:metallophosphoesterase family protein [Saccharopolyspora endophytica]|uniref:Metallophosphoesterase n=1 Tax=Saccharopolyspora endophytica TaxID=543886 RepID=A0ABS5DCK7_9PSEU|nr:metallophosphoesterase [Saccharopolyspora endophytica]MBQ0923970.1 metallophosphoesterase [Saccharopolyspora endophytica]
MASGELLAISDLHVAAGENKDIARKLRPGSDQDWLLVAGDVGEMSDDITGALEMLAGRFEKVVWVPGNHELWTPKQDPLQLRGEARYLELVRRCRELGVVTPEDEFPVWTGRGGPVTIAPLFVGYDYTFRPAGTSTKDEALAVAHESGVVCTDEFLLHPDPYPSRDAWCRARVDHSEKRLADCDPDLPTVLVNHYPLVRHPTDVLWYPEFAQWCGTVRTADWHVRHRAAAVVYGHLHIPRTTFYDGVRFQEVSIGYPREWKRRGLPDEPLRRVFPEES